MRRSARSFVSVMLLTTISAACSGTMTQANSPDAVASIVAATMAAITPAATGTSVPPTMALPTLLAPSSVPPTLPPVVATVIVPGATRITFINGATTGVVSAPIQAGQVQNYVLQALQAQPMLVNVSSLNNDVTLSIKTQGGTTMLNAAAHQSTWQGSLPQTEDYYLAVYGGATTENYALTVTIPARIKFAEGADSIKLTGKTVAGYAVTYTAFAVKGQKISVELTYLSDTAALTMYGFTDGQPYIRSVTEQTSFVFTLPATQDYIIQVVPKGGTVVSYQLTVKIK